MKSKKTTPTLPVLLKDICQILDDKKAEDVKVLSVAAQSSITDYLVVGTGTSEPHLRALRVELEKVIDRSGTRILGMDTGTGSGWLVIDAFDIMVHVLTAENRKKYALENLWKDAEEIPVAVVLNVGKTKSVPKRAQKKPAPRKTAASGKKPAKSKRAKTR